MTLILRLRGEYLSRTVTQQGSLGANTKMRRYGVSSSQWQAVSSPANTHKHIVSLGEKQTTFPLQLAKAALLAAGENMNKMPVLLNGQCLQFDMFKK